MFRTFKRTWWRNAACTIPGAGKRYWTGHSFKTEAEAREFCQFRGLMEFGPTRRGPRGKAYEYTSA